MSTNSSDIFNYEFNWYKEAKKSSEKEMYDICCEKFKKKGEKRCKKCPDKKIK